MTEEARKTLEELPEEEQEAYVVSYLRDHRRRKQKEEGQEDPYSALKNLRDARLSGPEDPTFRTPDWASTYIADDLVFRPLSGPI